jgi:hypothetical protein
LRVSICEGEVDLARRMGRGKLRMQTAISRLALVQLAQRTIQGIETVNMIRTGQVRWVPKGDIAGQVAFVASLFGVIG